MSLGAVLLIVLLVLLIAGLPNTGLINVGYGPSGVFGVLLVVVIVLLLLGRL